MSSPWLRRFAPKPGAGPRLVCFPHAGGAASAFVPLSRALAPDIDVLAVQYPARQDRRLEPPAASLVSLAEHIADAVTAELGDGQPYAFFGHSMGAALAYETARRLRASNGRPPVRLFLSGRGAPTPEPGASDVVHGDAELIAKVRHLGGTATGVLDEPDLLDMVLPALRADYALLSGYHWTPGPPLDVPFSVLIGDADPVVTVTDAEAWLDESALPGEFHLFPGGHFYLDVLTGEVAEVVRVAMSGAAAVG
ncbi:thioesterase II family protein [Streptomyces boluensis]|uniref:Alpha/beta fold hydrolase n=1 Tax=Streptomyces boluensis TaxID=1775135 RepID=A0A964XPU7_9ACTN|nr:alpha/beta fold hydrolase [Streptomyces boluensis]NBE54953.1 alpha/beta fold hydrolase [Streptomyces boluensis]